MAPAVNAAAWGGVMSAAPRCTPESPRSVSVNVAPACSGGVSAPAPGPGAQPRQVVIKLGQRARVGIEERGGNRRGRPRQRDARR